MCPGNYYHFGLKRSILFILDHFSYDPNPPEARLIKLEINIDGLPISKSSGSQFWPILGNIDNIEGDMVFPIGVYHGHTKPQNPNEYLLYFVTEYSEINENGIEYNGIQLNIVITKILCDAPAKAFILCVKNHNAYSSCTKCITEGTFINNRVTFPEINASLRTDEAFRNMTDENFHKGEATALFKLNIGLITTVPLDYMHLICLGVTKRL